MKKSLFVSFVVLVLLVIFAFPVAAANVGDSVDPGGGILDQIWLVIQSYAKHALALVGLIILDVLLGVAVAIREKDFDWSKLGDFYLSMVLPMLIGWIGFIVITNLATTEVLGPVYGVIVGDVVIWAAWLAVVATIGKSIVLNAKGLYGMMLPFPAPDDPAKGEG
jgi:hypothetical protein